MRPVLGIAASATELVIIRRGRPRRQEREDGKAATSCQALAHARRLRRRGILFMARAEATSTTRRGLTVVDQA
jgi:hypothetical protein